MNLPWDQETFTHVFRVFLIHAPLLKSWTGSCGLDSAPSGAGGLEWLCPGIHRTIIIVIQTVLQKLHLKGDVKFDNLVSIRGDHQARSRALKIKREQELNLEGLEKDVPGLSKEAVITTNEPIMIISGLTIFI